MAKSGCGNSLLLTQSLIPPPLTYQAAPLRCSGASSTRVTQTAHTARRSRQAPVRTMWCTRASAGRQGSGSWSKLTSQWRHSLPPRTPGTHGFGPLLLHALRKERCSLAHAPVAYPGGIRRCRPPVPTSRLTLRPASAPATSGGARERSAVTAQSCTTSSRGERGQAAHGLRPRTTSLLRCQMAD